MCTFPLSLLYLRQILLVACPFFVQEQPASPFPVHLQPGGRQEEGGPGAASQPAGASPAALLQLSEPGYGGEAEPVSHLAWGGGGEGRAVALVATAGSRVFLLSLQPFIDRQAPPWHHLLPRHVASCDTRFSMRHCSRVRCTA
jgi:hypothetical protein